MSRPRPGIFSLSVLVFPKGGDCINARQRKKAKASRLGASTSRPLVSSRLTFAAKAGPFVPVAAEGTSETDWLPEGPGFEPSVPRFRDGSFRLCGTSRSAGKTDSFLRGGPAVRIRLPPPGSHEQIEPSGELTTGRKQTYSDGRGTDGSNPIPSTGTSNSRALNFATTGRVQQRRGNSSEPACSNRKASRSRPG